MALQLAKPSLPSAVLHWIGETVVRPQPTFNEVVAIPIVHDWGPLGSDAEGTRLVTSFAEFEAVYGSGDTAGRDAVLGAFLGQGLASAGGGAGGVLVHRMATGSAAKALLTIQNTTPANALTLTAVYTGDRGESLSVVIEDDPVDSANSLLRLLFAGQEVERYSYPDTNIATLAALINARSVWVTAASLITGVALTATAGTSLAAGNNGDSVTSTQWLAALTALEFENFGIFAPFNLTDTGIKASIVTWMKQMASEMRPVRVVFGGAAGEDVVAALAELGSFPLWRDEHLIRLAVGTYHDDVLEKDLSTSQLAPRLAGVMAARGESSALTRALLGGLSVVGATGPDSLDLVAGRDGGLTLLRRVTHPDSELAVSQGVTTFNSLVTTGKPYALFSEPRIVGILDRITRQITAWGEDIVIGDLTVTDDTRYEVRKEVRKLLLELEKDGLAEPDSSYVNVDPPDDPDLADAIPYEFGFVPTRTANYLIGYGRVR